MVRVILKGAARVFLFLFFLECFLRLGGWGARYVEESRNKLSVKDKNVVQILSVGESMTFNGGDQSYSAQLERILNERMKTGRVYQVINKGAPARDSAHILTNIEAWMNQYKPDMVIVMMGVSDPAQNVRDGWPTGLRWVRSLRLTRLALGLAKKIKTSSRFDNSSSESGPSVLKKGREGVKASYIRMLFAALKLKSEGRFVEAVSLLEKLQSVDADPGFISRVRKELAEGYEKLGRFEPLLKQCLFFLRKDNFDFFALEKIREFCSRPGPRAREVIPVVQQLVTENPSSDHLMDLLGGCLEAEGRDNEARVLFQRADAVRQSRYNPVTQERYRDLLRISSSYSARLVLMQYPFRRIDSLKRMAEGQGVDGIIYVENKKNFEDALQRQGYDALFVDRFAGRFGHCTPEGYRLIAENLFNQIREALP